MSSITLTIIADMTANYGEGLGNISQIQKVYRGNKVYAIRSKESLKYAIKELAGFNEDLDVTINKRVCCNKIGYDENNSTKRSLEGGYMNTAEYTKRNSSFYLTDAVSLYEYNSLQRFHTNLNMFKHLDEAERTKVKKVKSKNNAELEEEKTAHNGLMPYQYEYAKDLFKYSITIDLDRIGVDENFKKEADVEEKKNRVKCLLDAIRHLSLCVKGNLDDASPLFVVGGIADEKSPFLHSLVVVKNEELYISDALLEEIKENIHVGLQDTLVFENEKEIFEKLKAVSINRFFKDLNEKVDKYYGQTGSKA